MGKITLEMIAKSPSHTKRRRDETVQQYVRRLTHLYFSEKNIDEIVSTQTIREKASSVFFEQTFVFIDNLVIQPAISVHLIIVPFLGIAQQV